MTTLDQINEIISEASNMILSGVILKNVTKHFLNLGVNDKLTEKLVRLAELKAGEMMAYKAN